MSFRVMFSGGVLRGSSSGELGEFFGWGFRVEFSVMFFGWSFRVEFVGGVFGWRLSGEFFG